MNNTNEIVTPHQNPLGFSSAIKAWRARLGEERVCTEQQILSEIGRSCTSKDTLPLAVIFPETLEEVQSVVKLAQINNVPLYPISCGKNWGYGSASPSCANSVVVNLSRMNRIIEVNPELAYAVVEPGVTQQQLYDYLENNHIPLTFDVTGSTPHASLIGNLVERGSGPSRYADHFLNSTAFEVVLGNAKILRTGFESIPGAKTASIFKYGIGPTLDGLFTQSNFGIVTQATIWLMPKPMNFSVLLASFNSDRALIEAAGQLRKLKLSGCLPSAVHIANDLRIGSVLQNFPFGQTLDNRCLNSTERTNLQKKWNISEWNLLASLDGTSKQVRANASAIKDALKGFCKIQICSEKTLNILNKYRVLGRILGQRDLATKLSVLRLMKGVPSSSAVRGTYWRKRKIPENELDPVRDKCGVIWCSPIVPLTSRDLSKFLTTTRQIFADHKIDQNLGVTLLTERACCCTVGIVFDLEDPLESERANNCYHSLVKNLCELGYPPYRLSSNANTEIIYGKDNYFSDVCSAIKQVFDPHKIIAPGKYGIS